MSTGKPVWPIEERPVPKSDVPGEWTSPTQPFPTKPAALVPQGVTENDLVDFTPEIKAEALRVAQSVPPWAASMRRRRCRMRPDGTNGTLTAPSAVGGINWPGGAVDPVEDVLYVASQNTLVPRAGHAGIAGEGRSVSRHSRSSRGPPTTVFGLPLLKPPYGRVTAVDLKTGERLWMVPHGNTPDSIKRNAKLQGVQIPNTGAQTRGTGLLVTSTLLFGGEGGCTPGVPRLGQEDRRRRRRDPVAGSDDRFPVTYTKAGRQYIAVAVRVGDAVDIVALSLEAATSPTGRGQP